MNFHKGYFLLTILLFLTEVFIGVYMHDAIIRPYGGDFLVVILIYCFVKSFFNTPVFKTATGALVFAYLVEISQYFHLVTLLGWEHSKTARIIMGTSFSFTDLLCYTLGILLVIIVEKLSLNASSVGPEQLLRNANLEGSGDQHLKFKLTRRIRICICIVITGLFLSGVTAFPIETELAVFMRHQPGYPALISIWLNKIYNAVQLTNKQYPFLSYGTDWLAFAHVMLAILFIGPLKDPVKNSWVIQFGIIAAIMIFPLALIAGSIRGIPFFWRLIDCSFGVVTLALLLPCYRWIIKLSKLP